MEQFENENIEEVDEVVEDEIPDESISRNWIEKWIFSIISLIIRDCIMNIFRKI